MIVLLQRVLEAQVVRRAEGGQAEEPLGAVGRGLLAFVCAEPGDSAAVIAKAARKTARLRIFEDENGKTNCSLADVDGEILLISSLLCTRTAATETVRALRVREIQNWRTISTNTRWRAAPDRCGRSSTGIFGADMKVELLNDGPFTILLDSDTIVKKK